MNIFAVGQIVKLNDGRVGEVVDFIDNYAEVQVGSTYEEVELSDIAEFVRRKPTAKQQALLAMAAEDSYKPPAGAVNAARRVAKWMQEKEDCAKWGTPVGWARMRDLAAGKSVSKRTVARMSAFARHLPNYDKAIKDPKYAGKPWKSKVICAVLGWGGVAGIKWANRIMDAK